MAVGVWSTVEGKVDCGSPARGIGTGAVTVVNKAFGTRVSMVYDSPLAE